MIKKKSKKLLLEKILSSQEFSGSKIYRSFLSYLIDCTEKGEPIKEISIAIDVLGKEADFNPAEDTIVRSHTYTLRKKLESYYFQEGKNDPYRLEIPKGHYEVQFVPNKRLKISLNHLKNSFPWILLMVIILIALIFWNKNRELQHRLDRFQSVDPNDSIWGDFIQSKLPVMLVPGDHVFYTDYFEKYRRELSVRDYRINSLEELDSLKSTHPDFQIRRSKEWYFPYHSLWSIPPILYALYTGNQKPVFRRSSDINPQILDNYNFIFVGSIKTLYALKHTLSKSHFKYEIRPHIVKYTHPDSNRVLSYSTVGHSSGPNEDLVLVAKLPGPADNIIFIIASYHSLGAPEVVNYLINKTDRVELEELFMARFNEIPQYFEILFMVTGIDKTAYNIEILICNRL